MDSIRSMLLPLGLLVTSNTVPWLLGQALGARGAVPLDFGRRWRDGERLFGAHKTWRGLASAMAGTSLVGWLAGVTPGLGAAFGALAMAGDRWRSTRRPSLPSPWHSRWATSRSRNCAGGHDHCGCCGYHPARAQPHVPAMVQTRPAAIQAAP